MDAQDLLSAALDIERHVAADGWDQPALMFALVVDGVGQGKDNYYFSDRHETQASSYDLLHMRLGYSNDSWSLALWGRNLTDEDYTVRGFGSFGNDPRKEYAVEPYYQYSEPRLVGVSASYSF